MGNYRPQRIWGKVIFSVACVKNSVHGGVVPGQVPPPGQAHPLLAGTLPGGHCAMFVQMDTQPYLDLILSAKGVLLLEKHYLAQTSLRAVMITYSAVHLHRQHSLWYFVYRQHSSLSNWEAIFGDNC